MKKQLLLAASVLTLSALSTDALAGCNGIYLAARGGVVNHNFGDTSESLGSRTDIDDNSWMGSGAIGYRWGYFRFEAEYIWREEADDKETMFGITSKSTFQTQSYMFNVYYDFSPYTMFTPYVMGGLGWTKIETSFDNGIQPKADDKETNFTWSIGGGLSAKVTNRFNVDLGYRFFNMDKMHEASIRAHEVYLGLRYVF